jgi:hypothetical protein
MPVDPSIPLGVRPVQLENPMNALAQAQQFGLNNLKMQEAEQVMAERNALRGLDINAPDYISQVGRVNPKLALELQQGQTKNKTANVELEAKLMTNARNTLAPIQDQGTYDLWRQQTSAQLPGIAQFLPAKFDDKVKTSLMLEADKYINQTQISASQQQTANVAMRGQNISAATAQRGQDIGRIPVGYRMTSEGTLEAMPGGPTTTPLAPKELQAREAKYPLATQAVKTVEAKSDKLIADIETLKNHPGLDSITGTVYGRTPSVTAEGRQAQALYDSIVARGGFQELAAMRAASPTGGALGNVSNQEGQQLKDAFGTLNRTQDASSLRTQLGRVADDVRGAKTRVREAYDMTYDYKAGAPVGGGDSSGGKADPLGIR